MDRRNKTRIDVELTCYVSPTRLLARTMKAVTKNVSRTGLLMKWAPQYPEPVVGKKLTIEIELPENSDFGVRAMKCHATIVRIDDAQTEDRSVALHIQSMKFVDGNPVKSGAGHVGDLASMPVPSNRAM